MSEVKFLIMLYFLIFVIHPLLIIFLYNKLFYPENFKTLKKIFLIYISVFIIHLLIFMKIGIDLKHTFFTIVPIIVLTLFKFFSIIFKMYFKENLVNTFTFVQFQIPIKNIWIHRIYNAIVTNLSFTIPLIVFMIYFFPTNETFNKILILIELIKNYFLS